MKISQVIKYHQKKALFVGKKGHVWVRHCMTAQLSVKVAQCRIAKSGLDVRQQNPPVVKWLNCLGLEVLST